MVVDERLNVLTSEKCPLLGAMRADYGGLGDEDFLVLDEPKGSVHSGLHPAGCFIENPSRQKKHPVVLLVDGHPVEGFIPDDHADRWLSAVLGRTVHLVFVPDPVELVVRFPALLTNTASLGVINRRARNRRQKISMTEFRPNIVIKGASVFEEDSWLELLIGSVTFYGVSRNLVTDGGVRGSFGIFLAHAGVGTIHQGDKVHVVRRGELPILQSPVPA